MSLATPDAARRAATMHPARIRSAHVALAALMFFSTLAGGFWRNLLGWWGWGAITLALAAVAIGWAIRYREQVRFGWFSRPLLLFALLAAASVIWSQFRPETLLGTAVLWLTLAGALPLASLLSWDDFLRALDHATRWIMGLSVLFELWVALVVRGPLLPNFAVLPFVHDPELSGELTAENAPLMLLWSRNLLFSTDKIQGITGNSIGLATVAAIAVIVIGLRWADARIARSRAILWMVVAGFCLWQTFSVTVLVGLLAAGAVLGAVLLRRRLRPGLQVSLFWGGAVALLAASLAAVLLFWESLLELLGKSADLTGRLEIWQTVIELAQQRPVAGWGWLGYWPPWVDVFDGLVVRWDVVQIHAHNAWLDLWLQLGLLGVLSFAFIVIITLARAWSTAAEPVWTGMQERAPYRAVSLFPLLLLVFLLTQSLAESQLLIEGGMLLFASLVLRTTTRPLEREQAAMTAADSPALSGHHSEIGPGRP